MKIKANKLNIEDVFEIAIDHKTWQKIKLHSKKNGITYSWITRLCAFRLIKKFNNEDFKFKRANIQSRKKHTADRNKKHRHMMCLFGEDAIQIRIYASKAGLTISQFVRVAILLYLKYFQRQLTEKTLIYYGTKIISLLVKENHNKLKLKTYDSSDYWPIRPRMYFKLNR